MYMFIKIQRMQNTHTHTHTHAHGHTHTHTHTESYIRATGLKKKLFEKRKAFNEDLKQLTEAE